MHDSRCMHFTQCISVCTISTSVASTSSPETSVFPCKADYDQSCTQASTAHTHTVTKALPIPLSHTYECMLIRPIRVVCVQLENTYSQTGEAPWFSRVSVSMSVWMAVADLTHTLLTDRELLCTLLPPSCPSLKFTPHPTSHWMVKRYVSNSGDSTDAQSTSISSIETTKIYKIWSKSTRY